MMQPVAHAAIPLLLTIPIAPFQPSTTATGWEPAPTTISQPQQQGLPLEAQLLLSKLASFFELQQGWDSYGAPAPNKQAILGAALILGAAASRHTFRGLEIAPSLEGGVAFEWQRGARELQLTATNTKTVRVEQLEGATCRLFEYEIPADPMQVSTVIVHLMDHVDWLLNAR